MLRRTVPADLDRTGDVTRMVREAAAAAGFPAERALRLELAVEEAFVNICRHAFPDGGGEVVVRLRPEAGQLTVELEDAGPAFDPLGVRTQLEGHDLESRSPGGVGLPMIRRLADSVTYRRLRGRNRLSLTLDRHG